MAFPAFISVKGKVQGQFKGEVTAPARKDKWQNALSFAMEVQSPRDTATGSASGKRQWKSVKVLKKWGASSPQALTALANNEILSEVVIEFTRTNPNGEEYVYQSVKLTDAIFWDILRFLGDPSGQMVEPLVAHETLSESQELEWWSFGFRKIEVVDNDGNTMFVDDWTE